MGDPQTKWELSEFLTKVLGWLVWILMGVAAKLAFDSRMRQLTRRDIIIKVVLSIFGGVMCGTLCDRLGYKDWDLIVTATGTYLGESVLVFLMTHWKKWLDKILPPLFRNGNGKKEEKEDSSL